MREERVCVKTRRELPVFVCICVCMTLALMLALTACNGGDGGAETHTSEAESLTEEPPSAEMTDTETPTEAPTEALTEPETEAETPAPTHFNFGFADPTQELWGVGGSPKWADADHVGKDKSMWATVEVNPYSTAENIAKINAAFHGNSARIWSHTDELCEPQTKDDENFFWPGALDVLQGVIDDFYNNGVTNIIYQTGVINTMATRNFYNSGDQAWYCMWDVVGAQHKTGTPYRCIPTMPGDDGSVSGISYAYFLDLQREYFRQLASTLEHVSAIEIMNEPECAKMMYRSYIQYGEMPPIEDVAQMVMDVCKMATEGIALAGKDIKVMMPALACVSGMSDRYDTVELLNAEYDYIKNHGLENHGTDDPDDYFQVVNIHPYVFLHSGISTTNYLYRVKGTKNILQTPEEVGARWRAYVESLREICIRNGDEEKSFSITEIGMASYPNGRGLDHASWNDYKQNTTTRQAETFRAVYDVMQTMPYLDTVIFFRLGDYVPAFISNPFVAYGEASYGIIDSFGELKDIGRHMYTILNQGSTDYSELLDVLKRMEK